MLKLKKVTTAKAESIDIKELFPDITEETKKKINENIILKKEIMDYVSKDRVGAQFNSCRLCSIPDDPEPLEKEVEDLEFELENMSEEDERRKKVKRELFSKKKHLEKLKKPYRYFDDICECYLICPLYKNGIAPVGEICYFEMQKVSQATEGYINEFGIDMITDNISREQIAQIVLCDLIIYRASRALAATNLTMIGEKVGELGVEYTRQRNHLIGLITEQNKMRIKLLKTMLGTKEIRKKYKMEDSKSYKQVEAEKAVAEIITKKESIKKNKVPNLIKFDEQDDTKFSINKVEDAEVV